MKSPSPAARLKARSVASRTVAGTLLAASILTIAACSTPAPSAGGDSVAESRSHFVKSVKPLLESRCSWCHSNDVAQGGLNFQDRDSTLNGARPFVVKGSPDRSLVYLAVTRPGAHPRGMPADGWGITAAQERALKAWITTGADWPEGPEGIIHRKAFKVDKDDYM